MPRKRVHFQTIGHVLTELCRQYRRADRGELPWNDAAAAARILREIRQVIEGSDLTSRIEALEARLPDRHHLPGPNGSSHVHHS